MFRGRYEHSLDDKGRLAVPAKFRELLTGGGSRSLIVTNFDKCLLVYSLEEWEKVEAKLSSLPQFDAKVLAFQRYFVSGATECPLDKSGRVLLPNNLRNFAKIKQECVICGQLSRVEIWSKEVWDDVFGNLALEFQSLAHGLQEVGLTF